MKFDSMIFYRTWMEAIDDLDDENAGKLVKAFLHYGLDGTDPDDLSPVLRALFTMGKGNIDSNNKKRENGSKGGKQTASKTKQTSSKVKQTTSKEEAPVKQPSSNKDKDVDKDRDKDVDADISNPSPSPRSTVDARFNIFWQTYPRKSGRESALNEWKRIKPDAELFERIISKINELKVCDDWTRENGRYVPNPQKWLESGGWDDEIPKSRSPAKKNLFSNFHQRDRSEEDFNELEKRMLQRGKT